jgi:putative flippase GtrA
MVDSRTRDADVVVKAQGNLGDAQGLHQQVLRQLWRFLLVGAAGFALDMAVLAILLYGAGYNESEIQLLVCRLVAFLAAITLTFVLNARYTFGAQVRQANVTGYLVIQLVGAGINLGLYALLVLGPLTSLPLVSMIVGAAAATGSNFLLSRRFVYRWR